MIGEKIYYDKNMNKTVYWIIGVVVVIALGFGGYKLMKHYQNTSMNNNPSASIPAASGNSNGAGLTNKTDTSNQQLDQDLQSVQSSMNKLNTDQIQSSQAVSNQSTDVPQQ